MNAPARSRRLRLTLGLPALACLFLAGCHHQARPASNARVYSPPPAPSSTASTTHTAHHTPAPVERLPDPTPANQAEVHGKPISTEVGLASWYGPPYHNRQAADGSIFDQNALTAAHRTLPFGTLVRVTNLATNESVVAKITDRGPFVQGRTLDLSLAAAKAIGVYRAGIAKVRVEAFAPSGTAETPGKWCVQIGVFIDPADAIQLKNDLKSRYTTSKVIEFAGPTGHWVRINPATPDHETAEHIADSIHLPDADAYLIRLN